MANSGRRDNVTREKRGNSSSYGLQRLERERPDLHERVRSGELSAHAAMVEAGFRKRSVVLSPDPLQAGRRLCEVYGPGELRVILRALKRELLPEPDRKTEKRVMTTLTYYAMVDGEEISKHRKASNAFRALERVVKKRKQRGEPPGEIWVRDDWGRDYD